jgi:ABC-2 type transport system ATP-binding protein
MSSHILTEVDRLATRIGIIHQGALIEEIEGGRLEELRSPRLEVEARDLEGAQRALAEAGFEAITQDGALILSQAEAIAAPDRVATILVNAGAPPTRLQIQQEDLEAHFLRLTGGTM